MSFLEQLRLMREDWVRANRANNFEEGIVNLLTELYPDNAHFIYELLQNAEDAQATKVEFVLAPHLFTCRHNGNRKFSESNVESITSLGKSTKRDDVNQIGKFGVGFKAVFSYTISPKIYSGDFSFEIRDLVCPISLPALPSLNDDTVFQIPFNKPEKPPSVAFSEIRKGLLELSETTLLFLANIDQICWKISEGDEVVITRLANSKLHYEIEYLKNDKDKKSVDWLIFSDEFTSTPQRQHVAIAFAMERLEKPQPRDVSQAILGSHFKIAKVTGQVSIYFPAEKETSKLNFHIHAPFASTVARDSIRTRSENEPLIQQLSKLLRRALHVIREEGLLSTEFLEVLPIPEDELSEFYFPLMEAALDELRNQPLTPTHGREHAPAKTLVQGTAAVKDLLDDSDLQIIIQSDNEQRTTWAANARQNSRADRLLRALEIRVLSNEDFAKYIETQACPTRDFRKNPKTGSYEYRLNGRFGVTPDDIKNGLWGWLGKHDDGWMQKLYALLYETSIQGTQSWSRWQNTPIVRVSDGRHLTPSHAYFPAGDTEEDDVFPRVRLATFSSGKSDAQKRAAKAFLDSVGVRPVGPREEVERILKIRYSKEGKWPTWKLHIKDFELFFKHIEENPSASELFSKYLIYRSDDEKFWCTAKHVYLDDPFVETGLIHVFGGPLSTGERQIYGLSPKYAENRKFAKRFIEFAETIGVATSLPIKRVTTWNHPHAADLQVDCLTRGAPKRDTGRDDDFVIENIDDLLHRHNVGVSKAVWMTLNAADPRVLEARFQANRSQPVRRQPSRLVLSLRTIAWIPLKDGRFVVPAEATDKTVAAHFPVENANGWLTAVGFSDNERRHTELYRRKEEDVIAEGFSDLEEYKAFTSAIRQIPESDRKQALEELLSKFSPPTPAVNFPARPLRNPALRTQRMRELAKETPEKEFQTMPRSVPIGYAPTKDDANRFLEAQYTDDGVMFCQACAAPLPFKLPDGSYYFEAVQAIDGLPKRFPRAFLALCPNHSAMFRLANSDRERMRELLEAAVGTTVTLTLANTAVTIRFTEEHLHDLKECLTSLDTRETGS